MFNSMHPEDELRMYLQRMARAWGETAAELASTDSCLIADCNLHIDENVAQMNKAYNDVKEYELVHLGSTLEGLPPQWIKDMADIFAACFER